ncbi:MAG: hypothetical protein IPG04_11210 [Polyangiaceae bacterium]|jgi:hypothetical protein|nr:hypothetical protein [Polyangiaceae bacterium]
MSRLPSIDPRELKDHADDARVERIWSRLRDDLPAPARRPALEARPRVARTALLFAAAFGMFGAGLLIGRTSEEGAERRSAHATTEGPTTDVFAAGTKQRSFALPGGGRLVVEPGATVEVVSVSESLVHLSLLRGAATFDAAGIPVDVVAGEALVSAPAGSSVSLARRESDLDVLVSQGSAVVTSPVGQQVVRGGHVLSRVPTVTTVSASDDPRETALPPMPVPVALADREPTPTPNSPTDAKKSAPALDPVAVPIATAAIPDAPQTWLSLAQSNKHKEALELLDKGQGLESTIKGAQSARELMYLWEVAATGSKSSLQVLALRRVADEFGSDPSAYVAAMQLAQLYEGSDKALAAKYREKAAQTKSLAEVALCAQVRAMVTEGEDVDPTRASLKATEYLQSYPMGSCADDAKSLLEDVAGKLEKLKKNAADSKTEPAPPASAAAPAPAAPTPAAPTPAAPTPAGPPSAGPGSPGAAAPNAPPPKAPAASAPVAPAKSPPTSPSADAKKP